MEETTPAGSVEYIELLELDDDAPPPLLDRPVLITAAERLPVETRIPSSWIASQVTIRPGAPVQIAGDHPARTRFQMVNYEVSSCNFVFSHSAETCTRNSGILVSNVDGLNLTGRGAIWVMAYDMDPAVPDPAAYARIDFYAEFLDG